jgi:hypothetical protein
MEKLETILEDLKAIPAEKWNHRGPGQVVDASVSWEERLTTTYEGRIEEYQGMAVGLSRSHEAANPVVHDHASLCISDKGKIVFEHRGDILSGNDIEKRGAQKLADAFSAISQAYGSYLFNMHHPSAQQRAQSG